MSSTAQPSATGARAAAAHHSADQLEKLREPAPPEWGGAGEARGRGHPPLWPPPRCGLRRQEVATLSGISVDYVVRLEQGRGPHSSASVLRALARALRLNDLERGELFELRSPRARPSTPRGAVRPAWRMRLLAYGWQCGCA